MTVRFYKCPRCSRLMLTASDGSEMEHDCGDAAADPLAAWEIHTISDAP